MGAMRHLVTIIGLALTLSLAACGGKAAPTPAAPVEPTPTEPAAADPELICCTVASSGEMMSSMVPLEECPEDNRTPDACTGD